jgi:hypothetical protein
MSTFIVLSWLLCIGTSVGLLGILYASPHLFVKPSIIVVASYNVQIQWASAYQAESIERTLLDPWAYLLAAQLFPPTLLAITVLFGGREAMNIWRRCKLRPQNTAALSSPISVLILALLVIVGFYTREVPWASTGLHAVIFDPDRSAVARENAMKLLSNTPIKYAFAVLSTAIAPVLAALLYAKCAEGIKKRPLRAVLLFVVPLVVILFCVSLVGARGPSAFVLITFSLVYLFRRPLMPKLTTLALVVALALAIPGLMTLLREGRALTRDNFRIYAVDILDRTFSRNIEDGIWHVRYVQRYGYFGVAGSRPLAWLAGIQPVHPFNVVGLYFRPSGLASISANCSYVIAYYGLFGVGAFFICLLLACALDLMLVAYRRISNRLLVPCVAACAMAATNLTSTQFTTALISGGLLVVPAVCVLLDKYTPRGRATAWKRPLPNRRCPHR